MLPMTLHGAEHRTITDWDLMTFWAAEANVMSMTGRFCRYMHHHSRAKTGRDPDTG